LNAKIIAVKFSEEDTVIQPPFWTREMLHAHVDARLGKRKFIVVANREPYMHRHAGAKIECLRPASGMAAALDPILSASGGIWIAHGSGDADRAMVDVRDRLAVPPEQPSYTLRRVWLSKEQEEGFYGGLANEGLWPLCHSAFTQPVFRLRDWNLYREVNALFARAVLEEAGGEPAFVFVQDYHLALLPRMLKNCAGDRLSVAHFWHIPWPNPEAFRAFPWRREILEGLLGNDLLGFQIRHHCRNFLEAVDQDIEARIDRERSDVYRNSSRTQVRDFPISIDFEAHSELAVSPRVAEVMENWRARLGIEGQRLALGIERLDYTKGIPERLLALDGLLRSHPEWRGRLLFVQVAVPSRTQLPEYKKISGEVRRLVCEINARWKTGGWEPVMLIEQQLDSTEMIALHRLADFCIVSSLNDGMNLVAKEFVASRTDEQGVLVLSRFTGSHRELPEALEINPFAVHEVSEAMHAALTMPDDEQRRRMIRMREQVSFNNVFRWAGKCLSPMFRLDPQEVDQSPVVGGSGMRLVA
jgi:trehalose 6-phosphate synthase